MKIGIFKLSDLVNKSTELSINDALPDCITAFSKSKLKELVYRDYKKC